MPRSDDPRTNHNPTPGAVHAIRGRRDGYGNIAAANLPLDCREIAPTITLGALTGTWNKRATEGNDWKIVMIAGAPYNSVRVNHTSQEIFFETAAATVTDSDFSLTATHPNELEVSNLVTFKGAVTQPATLGSGVIVGSTLRVWAIPTTSPDDDITINLTTGAAAAAFVVDGTDRTITIAITEASLSGRGLYELLVAQVGAVKVALDALIGYRYPDNQMAEQTFLGAITTIPVNAASAVYEFSGGVDYLPVTRIVARGAGNVVLVGRDDADDDAVTYTLDAGEAINVFPDKILSATMALTLYGL